ncbi:MAG: class I SAM-dependent methyltransferase, partial [Desulfosarcinaceae bacterium]
MDVVSIYEDCTREMFAFPEFSLGPHTSYGYQKDPKHLAFTLSRYKFCSKMLSGKSSVLEIGCGDGFGVPLVAEQVKNLLCIDWDEKQILGNQRRLKWLGNTSFRTFDATQNALSGKFDAAYAIDVIEHLDPEMENTFMDNVCKVLKENGLLLIGTPNKSASQYCSKPEVADQHINLYDHQRLRCLLSSYFENVFMFGMNDEVLHTGYLPMAHYLWGIGVGCLSKDDQIGT